jgi:hypothetical protein
MTEDVDWGAWAEEDSPKEVPQSEGYGSTREAEFVEEAAPVDPLAFAGVPVAIDPQPIAALLHRFKQECDLTISRAKTITIVRDPETNLTVSEWAVQTRKMAKELEELRKRIVTPYNTYLTQVNRFFKLYTDPLGQTETYLRRLLDGYRQFQENEALRITAEQEAQARKIQKQLEEEAKAAKEKDVHYEPAPVVAPVAPEVQKVTRTSGGSTSQRKDWVFEVEDESLIDREFLMLNEKKLREHIKGGLRNTPGIRIYEEFTTRIRA